MSLLIGERLVAMGTKSCPHADGSLISMDSEMSIIVFIVSHCNVL